MALDQIEDFMAAIRNAESGSPQGVYTARNPSGAFGAYQFMPQYWDSWASDAGIAGASINDPKAQDRVARELMTDYYNRFGSWDLAAVAWRAGPAVAEAVKADGWQAMNDVGSVNLATMQDYLAKVMPFLGEGSSMFRGPTGTPEATNQPPMALSQMAKTINAMSLRVAGGNRLPIQGLNTRNLELNAPDLVPEGEFVAEGGEVTANEAGDEAAGAGWMSEGQSLHTHQENAARLADPNYQRIANNTVVPIGDYLANTYGVNVSQYRDLNVQPQGGAPDSDHYWGGALDITGSTETLDQVYDWVTRNADTLGVHYVLWRQPNHYDHVHVSFFAPASPGAITDGTAALVELGVVAAPQPESKGPKDPMQAVMQPMKYRPPVGPDVGAYGRPSNAR